MDIKYDFFIAHPNVLATQARSLAEELIRLGRVVFIDALDRESGRFDNRIKHAQSASLTTVIVIGPHDPNIHPYFGDECTRAIGLRKRPLQTHDIEVVTTGEEQLDLYGLANVTRLKFGDGVETVAKQLVETLDNRLRRFALGHDMIRILSAVDRWAESSREQCFRALRREWRGVCSQDPTRCLVDPNARTMARLCVINAALLPSSAGQLPPLFRFSHALIAGINDTDIAASLRDALEAGAEVADFNLDGLDQPTDEGEHLEDYLLVHAGARTESGQTVQAWHCKASGADWVSTNWLGDVQVEQLAELGPKLSEWIDRCAVAAQDLHLEFVVPLADLACGPENWRPPDPDGEEGSPLGRQYAVAVRILERADPSLGGWSQGGHLETWRTAFMAALSLDDGNTATVELPETHADHKGCTLWCTTMTPPQTRTLLSAHVPIAAWARGEFLIKMPCVVQLENLSSQAPRDWRKAVRISRQNRSGSGHPAILLWDDPRRLVPRETY